MHTRALSAALVITCGAAAAQGQAADSARMVVTPVGTPVVERSAPVISQDQVERRTSEGFGDFSATAHGAALPTGAGAPSASWDIDVRSYEGKTRVSHYVALFSGRAKAHIAQQLSAGSRYESMIRARMREGGIPEDMYFLALIESGFDPNAYSRAAAVGMWQFMASTARDAGLRVDWWVDERRDPVRSTSAAVRLIRELRDQFGSLYLAAAAYNGGPARVSRGLVKYASDLEGASGDDAFFLLADKEYLRNETRDYVPQLIAAALIGKEPARYGVELRSKPAYAYDSVVVRGSTPLAAIARAAGAPGAAIVELNPHLLRGMTPPRESTTVRLPVGLATGFSAAFAALPPAALAATSVVESKRGSTADRLAEKHGISTRSLKAFNPNLRTLKSGKLESGQLVLVPAPSVAELALWVPDPSIEKFSKQARRGTAHVRGKSSDQGRKSRGTAVATRKKLDAGSKKAGAHVSTSKTKRK